MTSEIKIVIGPVASVFQPKSASLIQRKIGPTTSENDPEFWPVDFRYDWPTILRNDWPGEVRFRQVVCSGSKPLNLVIVKAL